MASFFKFNQFIEDLGLGVHNLDTGALKIYLSDAAPSATLDAVKADLAEITNQNGYTAPIDVASTYSETSGTGNLAEIGARSATITDPTARTATITEV